MTDDRERQKALLLLAIVLLGTLFSLVSRVECWPFCYYPMFSDARLKRTSTFYSLRGVTSQGTEISLDRGDYFGPIDLSRIQALLSRTAKSDISQGLSFFASRYARRRSEGRHDGPELRGVRLYRLSWTVRPHAENRDHPEQEVLVGEWRP